MTESLIDAYGNRKYVVPRERAAFISAARKADAELCLFCMTLAITGARISEVLALDKSNVDNGNKGIVFRTLKQRERRAFRFVPAPRSLLCPLGTWAERCERDRLWSFSRTFAWANVKKIMGDARIGDAQCMPKALRHGFAVDAVLHGVPLNILQRWMGHARIETTAIYANVIGKEERMLARRTWRSIGA